MMINALIKSFNFPIIWKPIYIRGFFLLLKLGNNFGIKCLTGKDSTERKLKILYIPAHSKENPFFSQSV